MGEACHSGMSGPVPRAVSCGTAVHGLRVSRRPTSSRFSNRPPPPPPNQGTPAREGFEAALAGGRFQMCVCASGMGRHPTEHVSMRSSKKGLLSSDHDVPSGMWLAKVDPDGPVRAQDSESSLQGAFWPWLTVPFSQGCPRQPIS